MSAPTVSLLRARSYAEPDLINSLRELLAPLGDMAAFVKSGDRVLLKPNLLTGARPTKECITRREIVAAVAQLVREAGGKPFFGDSPAFGSAAGVARANGYAEMMAALDIPVVEFSGQRQAIANADFGHLRLAKEALDADVVINLPKVKSHSQLTLTLGVKNLFGCVPGKMKAWWHMEAGKDVDRFATMLVETARAIAPELTIIDGILGHEGNGPSGGEPRELGILGASADVFALDVALVELLGVDPSWIPTLVAARALGCSPKLGEIAFPLHAPQDLAVTDWRLPAALMPIDFGLPRVLRSTFKHLYVRWLKEPLLINATSRQSDRG